MQSLATSAPASARNVADSLWRMAAQRPDASAIIQGERQLTFASLRDRAAAIALTLRASGIEAGDRVAILLERSPDAAATIFAAQALGAVAVCIHHRLRLKQIEYQLRDSGARALVTTRDMLARIPLPVPIPRSLSPGGAPIVDLSLVPDAVAEYFEPVARDSEELAQIIYTSGSTGLPKGVCFAHRSLIAAIDIVSSYLGLRASDRIASLLGFASVYGLNQLFCAVRCGATLVIETSTLPHSIVKTLRERGVSVVAAVPPLWVQLLSVPAFKTAIKSLRILQNAGGHLPSAVTRQLRTVQPHAQLFLQYGMTETFRSTFLPPEEVDGRPDCIGRPMPLTEIHVLREDLTPCAPGEPGELVHVGPTIASGYWNDRAATEAVFRPNPARDDDASPKRAVFSGDLVRRDADGFLYYVSRRDRLIKTLGFRVGPDEITDVLFASGEISECVIATEPDLERGNRIIAYIVLAAHGSLERLERFARTELPRYMQPTRIHSLDALPRLASGKYDVDALCRPAGEKPEWVKAETAQNPRQR